MAHAPGLRACAEGVETEEQLSVLRELGCDAAQGFLLATSVSVLACRRPRARAQGTSGGAAPPAGWLRPAASRR
jgi:EAL domain-containing protein (putative c-di-GMP-specific phosphodiesterase class I)